MTTESVALAPLSEFPTSKDSQSPGTGGGVRRDALSSTFPLGGPTLTESASSAQQTYAKVLKALCDEGGDDALPREAVAMSTQLIAAGLDPHEIVAIHVSAVQQVLSSGVSREMIVAQRFLLEVLTAYGVAYSSLTDRLLAEADVAAAMERTRSEDAAQSEKDRLLLLAGVSHELGSPLTVIKANVASIRRYLEERDSWPDELSQREDDVEFAVQRISSLRDELLAASRNEPRELEIVPLHLDRNVQRVLRWARLAAADKNLTLTEEYAADFPYAMGDEWAVESVVGNLVSNAVRYTPRGGTVNVRTFNEASGVAVAVTDTGIGISKEAQQRIFERFYRAPEALELAPFGLGLGLAIARDLVSALGGTIEVESERGAGSTFKVIFPLAADATDDA